MARVLVLSAHAVRLDRRISAQCNALVRGGREVTLVSVPTTVDNEQLNPSVRLVMPDLSTSHSAARRGGSLLPAALKPLRPLAEAFYGTGSHRWCTSFFRSQTPDEPFDVIHCHDLPTLPAALALRETHWPNAKVIYDAHEMYPHMTASPLLIRYWSGVERRRIASADGVLTVNEAIAARMAETYGIRKPMVLHNVPEESCGKESPLSETDFLDHFGCPPGTLRALFQGSLGPGRNLRNLVRGFGRIAHEERVHLCVLGGGSMLERLKAICGEENIDNVHFGDWVEQTALRAMLNHVHFGAIPYRGEACLNMRYCTPNKFYEYLEAGIPMCVNDLPALAPLVEDAGIGRSYPMSTPEETANALRAFLADLRGGAFPEARFEAARRAYSWERQEAVLLDLYERLTPLKNGERL